jgi:hypothetical protein
VCISMAPATFSGTTLYVGRKNHPALGQIEVLGYQNKAVNLAQTPNAMVLHIPANLTRDNFLHVGDATDILTRMVDALAPAAGVSYGSAVPAGASPVQVFEHDIYTVLLASDPTQIPTALSHVPPNKRPPLDVGLFEFYAKRYPYHSIVLCCFDNAEAHQAKPLLLWYPPPYADWLVAPALDAHTGGVPDLNAVVGTDHWLIFGADDAPEGVGVPVDYPAIDPALRAFLPDRVTGMKHAWPAPNGDFALSIQDLNTNQVNGIKRLSPTG